MKNTIILVTGILITGLAFAEQRTIDVSGTTREYLIEVPSNYSASVQHDLVLVFHGMGGTAQNTLFTGFHDHGAADHFITVYPQGLGDIDNVFKPGETTTGWKFETSGNRDVAFTETLLDSLEQEFTIRHRGIYVTGISNGGYFSDILACNSGDRLGAIAPVIGGYGWLAYAGCPVSKDLPVMHLGTEFDGIVDIKHLRDATAFWVTHNSCGSTPVTEGICDVYTGIGQDSEVRHCEFECLVGGVPATSKNAGCHTWPTKYRGYPFETTDMILNFFRDHGLGAQAALPDPKTGPVADQEIGLIIQANRVRFTLAGAGTVSLNLYSLAGKRTVPLIRSRKMQPGDHSVQIDPSRLSIGTFILALQSNGRCYSKKMVIIK
jgi:poly(3-hydroxybutyrate) depolymerase